MDIIPELLRKQLFNAETHRAFWYVMGISFAMNILILTSPLYMLQMYDRVLTSRSEETLLAISVIALFLLIGFGVLDVMRTQALAGIGVTIDERINSQVFTRLMNEAVLRGEELSAQPVRDLEMIRNMVSGHTLAVLFDLPWSPFFIILIFIMNPILGYVALAGALISILLAFISNRSSRTMVEESVKKQIASSRFVDACLRNTDAIKANGFLDAIRMRWLTLYRESVVLGVVSADKIATFSGTTKAFRMIMQSAILGCGAWLALQEEVSPGVMIAASIIFGRAIAPLDQSIAASKGLVSGLSAMKRLAKLLDKEDSGQKNMSLPKPKGNLKVEELALIPLKGGKPVLQNINFELAAGEILALIGPSASGKSSLARAIVGLWPPVKGKVRIDGADIMHYPPDTWGEFMGYLPQDIELLAGTVKENIARFSDVQADKVLEAANQAGCHQLILNLPKGYDTYLGEDGYRLSGGQSQRIALARAYFGSPSLVVLDEPDSSLDIEGLEALNEALTRMKQRGTTAVLVTHNSRLLHHADKALLLGNGGMTYFGPPDELIKKIRKESNNESN